MKSVWTKKHGFTLIEMIVVIAIISVVFVGMMSLLDPLAIFKKARDHTRKEDLHQVQLALNLYYLDHGNYPCFHPPGTFVPNDCTNLPGHATVSELAGTDDQYSLISKYMVKLPFDPKSRSTNCFTTPYYLYWHTADRKQYVLFANLENGNDPDAKKVKPNPTSVAQGTCTGPGGTCTKFTVINNSEQCHGQTFNYWVFPPD